MNLPRRKRRGPQRQRSEVISRKVHANRFFGCFNAEAASVSDSSFRELWLNVHFLAPCDEARSRTRDHQEQLSAVSWGGRVDQRVNYPFSFGSRCFGNNGSTTGATFLCGTDFGAPTVCPPI